MSQIQIHTTIWKTLTHFWWKYSAERVTFWVIAVCLAAQLSLAAAAYASTYETLITFDQSNGEDAFAPPIQGIDGNLYGATTYGGPADAGMVYRMTFDGTQTVLYTFCLLSGCPDGAYPAWLMQTPDGNFYGATYQGGASGAGTLFEITPNGALTTLYSFCSQPNCTDGALPQTALVQGADGAFYGTTAIGGANNQGTIFKYSRDGRLTTLHDFCARANCADGAQPFIGLTLAADKNFYGVAALGGGTSACPYPNGCGTVFRFSPTGAFATLHRFCAQAGCPDGATPQGLLTKGADGDLYGTTDGGGANGYGTAFKLATKTSASTAGALTKLHDFCVAPCSDGGFPDAGLIQGQDSNFYGTTMVHGSGGYGAIFMMTPEGDTTTLFSFTGGADGRAPAASLLQATNGDFYGGTTEGGDFNCFSQGCGVLFRLTSASTDPRQVRDIGSVGSSRRQGVPLSPTMPLRVTREAEYSGQ